MFTSSRHHAFARVSVFAMHGKMACISGIEQKSVRGFTLIELLVVIAIIGILSSVVLVSMGGARASARDAKRVAEISSVQGALELYYDACGQYPDEGSGNTIVNTSANGCPSGVTFATFLSSVPVDPQSPSKVYVYRSYNTGTPTYVLKATLEGNSNIALNSDVDGSVTVDSTAVDCNDPQFCLRP